MKTQTVHLNNDCDSSEPASLDNNPNSPQIPAYDPFEIRLEIFQYANPLRAKILIFSLLFHPWDRSGQDWSTLRSYTLEDLLQQLIESGKSLKDIEIQLYNIAQTQMDTDANVQTASILVQTLQKIREEKETSVRELQEQLQDVMLYFEAQEKFKNTGGFCQPFRDG